MNDEMPTLHELLLWMVESGASDLHISAGSPPVFRRHGALERAEGVAPLTGESLRSMLGEVTEPYERERFEESRELDKALDVAGAGRFRVNAAFERGEPYLAFRRINDHATSIEQLGLPPVVETFTALPRGLVLVTGPTGSGKSTTLAAMIDRINERDRRHIVTVEDPIEFLHQNKRSVIKQREVGSDTQSFAVALRHALRQDPDVILIGEMRDLETMSSALTAAETGHLVFATLHTPDAPQSIDRIVDAFPSYQQQQVRLQLSMVIEGVVSQVLVPTARQDGRVAACEVMVGTAAVRNLIRESKTHQIPMVMATGAQHGMCSLDQALAQLVRSGTITREVALACARLPEELDRLLGDRMLHAA
jgi:twitching motility protein PilT